MQPRCASSLGRVSWGVTFFFLTSVPLGYADVLEVPTHHTTVQAAINAAVDGDVVLLEPGTYGESLLLSGKAITVASRFYSTGDPEYIGQTIIDGGGGARAIRIEGSPPALPTIIGLTIRNADDGVSANTRFQFLNNRVTDTGDGIDYENNSGGLVRGCVFEGNADDGIDLDNAVAALIENNVIRDNGDDGIEIRLHPYTGPPLSIVIRDNVISGNREDGIQLISYDVLTHRSFTIERNLIANNAMAGIGTMCCENTDENYAGADMREPVGMFNNTFIGNNHAVTAGDSLVALNNVFVNSTNVAVKRADAGSVLAYNLFFGNGTNYVQSNVDGSTTVLGDPLLDLEYRLGVGSPAIDAGTASFERNGTVVWSAQGYSGAAPDLGAFETLAPVSVPKGGRPSGVRLLPPSPNPSRGSTALRVDLPVADRVRLEIVDVAGRQVRLLADQVAPAGRQDFAWDGLDASGRPSPAGVYCARLVIEGLVQSKRFVRLR